MTRELIIECMTCKEECDEEDSCFECAEKQLSEYENQIYNQALEDLQKMIDFEYYDGGYGDYHEVEMISRMIEKLKKQNF